MLIILSRFSSVNRLSLPLSPPPPSSPLFSPLTLHTSLSTSHLKHTSILPLFRMFTQESETPSRVQFLIVTSLGWLFEVLSGYNTTCHYPLIRNRMLVVLKKVIAECAKNSVLVSFSLFRFPMSLGSYSMTISEAPLWIACHHFPLISRNP